MSEENSGGDQTEFTSRRHELLDEGKITSTVPVSLLGKMTPTEVEFYNQLNILQQRMDKARQHIMVLDSDIAIGEQRMSRLKAELLRVEIEVEARTKKLEESINVRLSALEAIRLGLNSWRKITMALVSVVVALYAAYQWLNRFFNPTK